MFKPGSVYRVISTGFLGEKNSTIIITSCENLITDLYVKEVSKGQKMRTVIHLLEQKEDSAVFQRTKVSLPLIESLEDLEFWTQNLELVAMS
jgi:hypothetical protein